MPPRPSSGHARPADYAAAAAAALLADVDGDVTYELGGPAFSFADLAATITDSTDLAELLGRPVTPLADVVRAAHA